MKYILAIDQGTTGSRSIVYDQRGNQIASAYQEFKQYFPKPGWVEHNPDEIWKSVNATMQKVLQEVPYGSIAAIGITNQRETTVVWNRETGEPVYNAIVWQCRRTADRCKQLAKKKGASAFIRRRTGLPIDAYFSASKIEWILKNVRGARAKAKRGKLCFGTTDSWILWKLTGGKVHATDYTNASRTMLFNIERLKWDHKIAKKFNIPYNMLPDVKPSSGVFGRSVRHGHLSSMIPIAGIAGDQQAALFGQTCFESGSIKNTYGTGSFILMNTGKKRIHSKYGLITTLGCNVLGERPVYVLEGSVFIAGAAIQWLRDGLNLFKNADETETMAQSVESTEGVYFVPAFVGLGAPYWDQQARGCISGLTRGVTKNHIVRAALEALCYQTRDVLDAMQKEAKMKIKTLQVDGGAVKNNFLCQFQADVLQTNVVRPKIIEITALGAAYLAGLAVNFWKNPQEIRKCWQEDTRFTPSLSRAKANQLYNGWKTALEKTRSR